MKVIEFKVRGQRLEKATSGRPVAGSKGGYLTARFSLDGEWEGARVAASFFSKDGTEHAVLLGPDAQCKVPDAVTDGNVFRVSLTGDIGGTRITTNKAAVMQEVV